MDSVDWEAETDEKVGAIAFVIKAQGQHSIITKLSMGNHMIRHSYLHGKNIYQNE